MRIGCSYRMSIRRWGVRVSGGCRRRKRNAPYTSMNDLASPSALKTVLIVDDDPDSRRTIAAVLTEGGFDVAEAADAASAIERLQQESATIGMVLTDVTMPGGMTGVELAYHVRGN